MYLKINKKNKKIRENSIKLLFYKKFHQVNPKILVPFSRKTTNNYRKIFNVTHLSVIVLCFTGYYYSIAFLLILLILDSLYFLNLIVCHY